MTITKIGLCNFLAVQWDEVLPMIPAMDISPGPRGKDGSSLSRNLHGSQKALKNLKVTWSLHLSANQFCKKTNFGLPEPVLRVLC